jgi:hypothetical protein
MKALKLAMVAVLIASTVVCLAGIDGIKPKPKKVITMTLLKARHIPDLVATMHAQLDPSFLFKPQKVYTQEVTHKGALYRITGTYDQWRVFFYPNGKYPKKSNKYLERIDLIW